MAPLTAAIAAGWCFAREHLRRTPLLAFLAALVIAMVKDLGTLVADGITVEGCVVCDANFVVGFALLNVGLLLARPRGGHARCGARSDRWELSRLAARRVWLPDGLWIGIARRQIAAGPRLAVVAVHEL